MPHYIIHIGPHKTGTTYLQHAFTRLRPSLEARGILYPEQWGGIHGHHELATSLKAGEDETLPGAFERLNRSDADVILLSSETFSYFTDAGVQRLHGLLRGQPATVVFYCRRWSELIPSNWRELVKHGWLMAMPEYALSCIADPTANVLINFDLVLARYAAVFGADSLRIVSYNGVIEANQNLLTHFCGHFLGWPDPPLTGNARVNESYGMVDTEILRALNAMAWMKKRGDLPQLFNAFAEKKAELPIKWLVENAMKFTVDSIAINDAAPALAQLHARIAERYKACLVDPHQTSRLFEPRSAVVQYVRSDYLMAEGVIETLRRMLATLDSAAVVPA